MEDEQTILLTPTQKKSDILQSDLAILDLRHETRPTHTRGQSSEAAHNINIRRSVPVFRNSKSFSTFTTNLCADSKLAPTSSPVKYSEYCSSAEEINNLNVLVGLNNAGVTKVNSVSRDLNSKRDLDSSLLSDFGTKQVESPQMGILLPADSPFLKKTESPNAFRFEDEVCAMDSVESLQATEQQFTDDPFVSSGFTYTQEDSNGFTCTDSQTSQAEPFSESKNIVGKDQSELNLKTQSDVLSHKDVCDPSAESKMMSTQESTLGDAHIQRPLPFASYTDGRPLYARQLSKRKSDTIETCAPFETDHVALLDGNFERQEEDEDNDDDEDDDDYHSCGRLSSSCTPTLPKSRRLEDFDPYQIFQVQHSACLILTVRVIRGRNITVGVLRDYLDTPDPYINLVMKNSPDGKKCTSVKENCVNPEWNETFTFFLNFTHSNVLEISLMESNYLLYDINVGTEKFDIRRIRVMEQPQYETITFNGISEVDMEFKLEFDQNPTLRYSLCLSDAEKQFLAQRKEQVLKGVKKLFGDSDLPISANEVPTIAVIGSGGGFRAMTGYSGVFKALVESGVLDCSTYACGLSGSSWLLSTLYSHPKWPNIDMNEFLEELKNSIDKSLFRFFNASTIFNYAKYMVQKRREGQPVSFTDIFGRMVGETLLNGRMECTLTDQREKIKGGNIPMPLYTCVHVKKDVPAKSFQEWVEFSPYEIGMPKYGTFMDSELFGSKFFMGKLVKKYEEQPLHFLQGIWGSAFCVLFRRLLEDNRRMDPAEMMRLEMDKQQKKDEHELDQTELIRLEMGKELEEEGEDSSSDPSEDEEDEDDEDSSGSSDSSSFDTGENQNVPQSSGNSGLENVFFPSNGSVSMKDVDQDSAYNGESDEDDMPQAAREVKVELKPPQVEKENLQGSTSLTSSLRKSSFDPNAPKQEVCSKKSVNWGELPTRENTNIHEKRQAYTRAGSSFKKSKGASKSYWKKLMQGIFESNSWEFFTTRRGRAAVIHNFMRGLNLQQTYPLSPFTPLEERVKEGDVFDGIFEMHPTNIKHIYMVDAGLTFNSPYPLVLRPQRQIDIILSFDFSARATDNTPPFKELKLAEQWAKLNRLPFPPIDTSVFNREGMKELYIFRHPNDPHCPIVFHFVLINKTFKNYKAPGIPRKTKEEFDFANFDVFDDPKAPFSTFNFTYTHENFERMSQLMEFNTLLHIEEIKQAMRDVIKIKREGPSRRVINSEDIKFLRLKSVQEMRKLKKFISRMEGSSKNSNSTPSPQFYTPQPHLNSSNPFFGVAKASGSQNMLESTLSTDYSGHKHQSISPRNSYHTVNFDETDSCPEELSHRRNYLLSSSSCESESIFGTPPQNCDHLQKFIPGSAFHKDVNNDSGMSSPPHHEVFAATEIPLMSNSPKLPSPELTASQVMGPKNTHLNRLNFIAEDSGVSSSSIHTSPIDFPLQTKASKDSPPNPFFAHMRSCTSLLSSSSSSCDTLKRTKGKSRSHCSSDSLSRPVAVKNSTSPLVQPPVGFSPQVSVDVFTIAPEAFKADGTPVTDTIEAKMYYESAKARRKLLRRQSTISSLNSISLDEICHLDKGHGDEMEESALPDQSKGNKMTDDFVEMSAVHMPQDLQNFDDIKDLSVFSGTI
ncbi:cytosolic phospholipase A2-like isoform X2 [Biomphalaria pfeifferi]|uniref:Phospholipase A2 n=1 Tax=Biomphalaria pfeifferi TaxID=112525 RepID=A0AAD8FF70_BIOPF|nr:cytosolic phospholipase A2-like isoform X2 [Biomphalaria pfeifferi]